jgi:hypothetical protein
VPTDRSQRYAEIALQASLALAAVVRAVYRHNAQTYKKNTKISSRLDASTTYIDPLLNSDEIKNV